jgi:hypothetical protein
MFPSVGRRYCGQGVEARFPGSLLDNSLLSELIFN